MKLTKAQREDAHVMLGVEPAHGLTGRVRAQVAAGRLAASLAPSAALGAALALLVAGVCLGAVLVVVYTNGRD